MAKSIAVAAAVGTVTMRHDSAKSCSFDGTVYTVDDDGDVLVPAAAVAALVAHGFVAAPLRKPGKSDVTGG